MCLVTRANKVYQQWCTVVEQETVPLKVWFARNHGWQNEALTYLASNSGHMATSFVTNVDVVKVSSVHYWSDSTVTLNWINGQGEYRQFVSNRVAKIKEQCHIQWHHVPTEENAADLGS